MSFKKPWVAVAALSLVAASLLPAAAQVANLVLGDVDPFGRGYLEAGEPAMPTNMWKASRTEDLLPLMRQVRTRSLTPSERLLLRRVVLSPAARPEGDMAADVLAERARILYELGEADAAADLLGRLDSDPEGLNAAELAVDLQLALGNQATACQALTTETREGLFWAKLRAVCAILQGNTDAAELALELVAEQEAEMESPDPWFGEAIFAASLETPGDVPARFDTGLNLTLSTHIGLAPPEDAISVSRPDLAAVMAGREAVPLAMRVQAAGVAAEAGLIAPDAHRALYTALLETEGYEPARAVEIAVAGLADPAIETPEKADRLAEALGATSANPARFQAASRLFASDIAELERNAGTARFGTIFARAAIAIGDLEVANAWIEATSLDEAPAESLVFDRAALTSVIILAEAGEVSPVRIRTVGDGLAMASDTPERRIAAARLFGLWTALGLAPPPAGRALMANVPPETGVRGDDGDMLTIRAAAEAGAAGEVVVSALALTSGDPSGVATSSLLAILDSLSQIGAEDVRLALALEATGYWRVPVAGD